MARLARLHLSGVPQHIIQRGNNRQAVFFCDEDRAVYLDKLREYAEKYDVSVHAFVLLTNHVHVLLTPATVEGASRVMQSLGRYYVRYINQTYGRSGTLWEGRYKSSLVDEEGYFLAVSRYVELNPVRARMVGRPGDYPWSSYRCNALGADMKLISPHPCYKALGNSKEACRKAYRALFKRRLSPEIRDEIEACAAKGWALGSDRFKAEIEKTAGRRVTPKPRGGDRKSKTWRERAEKL
ncbi:MAG: transposase [Rhodospirillales bacterium]|nr:transposase [Rhodospirillales bacterium]